MTARQVVTLRRLIRNERKYPWERTPRGSIAHAMRQRTHYALMAFLRLGDGLDRAIDPQPIKLSERRESVRSYLGMARIYLGLVRRR